MRWLLFLAMLIYWPISAFCASTTANEQVHAHVPDNCIAGQKVTLKLDIAKPLPASSFYRVEITCPLKPDGSEVKIETGYPDSDLLFSMPGHYECAAEIGILTRSSCAGVHYAPLGTVNFSVDAKAGEE